MERQEHKIGSFQIMPKYIGLWVVLAVLLFFVSGWGSCNNGSYRPYSDSRGFCKGDPSWGVNYPLCSSTTACGGSIEEGGYFYYGCNVPYGAGSMCNDGNWGTTLAQKNWVTCVYRCGSQCDVDSIICVQNGSTWREDASASCGKSCQEPCNCDDYQANCESLNGEFSGNCANANPEGGQCCVATCYLCNTAAAQKQQEMAKKVCCASGMVPPKLSDYCFNMPPPGKCGMNYSNVRNDFDSQWKCRELDENSSQKMVNWYREACLESSSSAVESSPSSGASSGGDGSSSSGSPYPPDCPECPWLDSILDTLTAQKGVVDEIRTCVLFPSLCGAESEDLPQIDTSLLPYLRPFMDSTVKLSREQIELLAHLDTNMLKILDSLSKLPKSDTALMLAVNAASSNIEGKLNTVNTSIVHMNDSTKKWLRRIADSTGISRDSLINHLDSIKNRIPTDILDSILKYQKLASESDSIAVNVDLSSIDSLIDSTVSYFNKSLRADSLRGEKLNDSLAAIHDAIQDISYKMYQLLGYGDTASNTLRNDIEGVSSAVNEYRDSALKYFALFGDSMGAINSALGALLGKLSPGAIDTNGLGVWASYMRSGENMGDSIVNSYGWQNLKNLDVDSNYSAALGGLSNKTDSISGVVDDSLSNKAARLNDSLVRKNDSLKRNLPDTLTKYADSLVIWAPFADFDSIIYSTLGTRIPNKDECPEDCQKWSVSIPIIGLVNYTVDYGLCLGRASLGNLSVLAFLKLLIRIIVAITCVMIIYRTLIGLK